ncbi:MAG: PSD1 domain-containing protein [Verrucomicrobia bacterium]|nr:PSD1 domain-containing protein [Verrucomicrobiota bacterium]
MKPAPILLLASLVVAVGVATAADAKKKKLLPKAAPAPAAKPAPAAAPAAKAPAAPATVAPATALTADQSAFFENKIRPILAGHCLKCHSTAEGKTKGGLALDTREGTLKGGDSGPAVVPGNPDKSSLIRAVRYTDPDLQMPPKGEKLSDAQIADLVAWVKMGAPDPRTGAAKGKYASATERKVWWAFQPVKKQEPPAVQNKSWPANPVDNFILAKLDEKNLKPSAPADRRVLIRRLYFDLIGLPPTPAEVEAFVNDKSSTAYEKLVDKLLASPHYGERWGRHWLDVARYSDTVGDPAKRRESPAYPFAWTYRDYVVKAFNDDKPYDQFIREQIAADKLPNNRDRTTLAALGFITVGDHFDGNRDDIINDRIDVVTKGFNGLTVACARCHDHMFDPIPTKDYYALHGIFASTEEPKELPIIATTDKVKYAEYLKEKTALDKAETDLMAQAKAAKAKGGKPANKKELQKQAQQLTVQGDRLDMTHPGAPARAMAVQDSVQPKDSPVYIRGEKDNHGPTVPRRYLEVFRAPNAPAFKYGSGRLELAYSIANKNNPLTSRVMVNRVWQHHFGEGFVLTPDDFGTMSTPPSHPELLDYLSTWFMDNGWSAKKLHKHILMSATYQQASTDNPRYAQIDPFNRLLWRQNVRRLEFEPMRDSILAMAGSLDTTLGGRPVNLGGGSANNPGKEKAKGGALRPQGSYSTRRTLYGYIDRANVAEVLNHFDFAQPEMPNGKRYQTTVPQQALFLMNNPLVIEQARKIVERTDFKSAEDDEKRIAFLYGLIFQRPPSAQEIQLGLAFFEDAPAQGKTTALPAPTVQAAPVRVAAAKGKLSLPARPVFTPRPLSAWAEYAHALILANEFTFVN